MQDKIAIITGAGSIGPGWGNGKATSVLFAREGAKILACDINLDPVPENLFRDPLAYLSADHLGQRHICDLLDAAARDPATADTPARAEMIRDFLQTRLPRHCEDEEKALFPILIDHAPYNATIARVIEMFQAEHQAGMRTVATLCEGLGRLETHKTLWSRRRFAVLTTTFTTSWRRHIDWEDSVLLPIAASLIDNAELREIGIGMAERRGLTYPE